MMDFIPLCICYAAVISIYVRVTMAFFEPCQLWMDSHYVHAKCLKVVSLPNSSANPRDACQDEFPTGQFALMESSEEMETLKNIAVSPSLTPVVFRMTDPSLISRWTCHTHCDSMTQECVACQHFFNPTPANNCNNCQTNSGIANSNPLIPKSVLCQQVVPDPCQSYLPGATYREGHCFKVINDSVTWTEAQKACDRQQAFLVEVTSRGLYNWITQLNEEYALKVWTGASNYSGGGNFTWSASGLDITSIGNIKGHWDTVIQTWQGGATTSGLQTPDYYAILSSNESDWTVVSGNERASYMCQREIINPCDYPVSGGYFGESHCFKYYAGERSYSAASKFCVRLGGQLVEPWSWVINDIVLTLIPAGKAPWLGNLKFHKDHEYLTWRSNSQRVDYQPWETRPDSSPGVTVHGAFSATNRGQWVLTNTSVTRDVVCQTAVKELTRRYVIPLNVSIVTASSSLLEVTSELKDIRVYVRTMEYSHQNLIATTFSSVTYNTALVFTHDRWRPSVDLIKLETSFPVTVQLFLTRANYIASSLVLPSFRAEFRWFKHRKIFLSATDKNDTSIFIIPTHRGNNRATMIFELEDEKEVSIHGMDFSFGSGFCERSLDLHEEFHVIDQPVDGVATYQTNKETSIFMVTDLTDTLGSSFDMTQLSMSPPPGLSFMTLPCFRPYCAGVNGNELWVVNPDKTYMQHCMASTPMSIGANDGDHFWKVPVAGSGSPQLLLLMDASYVWQILRPSNGAGERTSCRLIPQEYWRHTYSLHLPPEVTVKGVHLVLFLNSKHHDKILLDGGLATPYFTCEKIHLTAGHSPVTTNYSSCTANLTDLLDSEKVHHLDLDLGATNERFGAYLLVWTGNDLTCHPLGMTDIMWSKPHDMVKDSGIEICDWQEPPREDQDEDDTEDLYDGICYDPGPDPPVYETKPDLTTPGLDPETTPEPCPGTRTQAPCECESGPPLTIKIPTQEEKETIIQEIRRTLHVEPTSTSAHVRRYSSAQDHRSSSTTIGILGVFLTCVTVGLIVVPDILTVMNYLTGLLKQN